MTEAEARQWIADRFGSPVAATLEALCECVIIEQGRQNLIAQSTIQDIWTRHIVDSAQLLEHVPAGWHHWVDVGTGGGFPGLVIAILSSGRVTMVEPRRLRAEFLERCVTTFGLADARVYQAKAEHAWVDRPVSIVSARAVASLPVIFAACDHFCDRKTMYVLPKGQRAHSEVASLAGSWQGSFHVEQSIVDPKSGIIVATGVAPR